MQPLTLEEFKLIAQNAKSVAVFLETSSSLTPLEIYHNINAVYGPYGVIFEKHDEEENTTYSYMAFEPIASLAVHEGDQNEPFLALRKMQSQYAFKTRASVAGLITGAVGYMTYDLVRYFEKIPDRHLVNELFPVLFFQFYTLSITYNHSKKTILISAVINISDQPDADYKDAQLKIEKIIQYIGVKNEIPKYKHNNKQTVETDVSDEDFKKMVEKAKKYIIAGDAFQIVLSRCFKCPYSIHPLKIYESLKNVSPAPYMFYFPMKDYVLLGASPERMVRVSGRKVTVNPIAGTRKRKSQDLDEIIKNELLNNEKERAEHTMLVDLARNDVGSVCQPGSVEVKEFMQVKFYSHVVHMTSIVQGQLEHQYDAFDAFAHTFPAGTLSGAPKIRAMEIIDELETSRRGLYGGAIARIDGKNDFDSCIAIRMAVLQDGVATIRVGAGIVYDSNPLHENEETYQKAESMLHAIKMAHGE